MRLADLEKELRAYGFAFQRQCGSHLMFRDAAGHTLVITNHAGGRWGTTYCRGELAHIRRTVARLLLLGAHREVNS